MHSFASRRLTGTVVLAVAAAALLSASNALAEDTPPDFTSGPTIVGVAVVGATLTADATWTGEPPPQVRYVWRRCPATGGACQQIDGADSAQYLLTNADLGFRLGLRMQLKSKGFPEPAKAEALTTAVVVEPAPPPSPGDPLPPPPPTDPDPDPDPGQTQHQDPTSTPVAPASRASFPEPVAAIVSAASRPALLRPFPIVRIRGDFEPGGVRITLLSVNAPRSARIAVRCTGRGCPLRSLSIPRAPARLRPFERFLAAGTVLQVRVTRAGRIGKYASFRIRAGSAPLRTDRCLMPGSAKPAACSAP